MDVLNTNQIQGGRAVKKFLHFKGSIKTSRSNHSLKLLWYQAVKLDDNFKWDYSTWQNCQNDSNEKKYDFAMFNQN